jgi:hypothetical protein
VTDQRGQPIGGASINIDGTFWQTLSSADGRFRLALPAGSWTLRVRRLGYQPMVRAVAAGTGSPDSSLQLSLAEAPSELRGVVVTSDRSLPMASTISSSTVRHVPPLGEPDIFRLLPLLPSISQTNDLMGRVHIGGGATDEHGVYLDGHPLQAAFHVFSVLGAFNVAALERADVLIHHVPSALEGRLSGTINLESRRASAHPTREAVVTILSASLTATQPSLFNGVNTLASGRATYMDRVVSSYARNTGASDDLKLPSFRDALLKFSRRWSNRWSAELLGYGTLDSWSIAKGPQVIPPHWSEGLLGVRARNDGARWQVTPRQARPIHSRLCWTDV